MLTGQVAHRMTYNQSSYSRVRLDIVDAIGGWKTSGVGHGYGSGYPLDVLNRWMKKL